jgi:hypothetical protein
MLVALSTRTSIASKMTAKLVLPLLSVFALYAIFYFAEINGLNHLAQEAITAKTLPGTNEPLRTVYTGIAPVDNVLAALTTFFWPATDGSNPTLTLHSIAFSGTFGAAWTLVTLESWRRGNAWTIAALSVPLSHIYETEETDKKNQSHDVRPCSAGTHLRLCHAPVLRFSATQLRHGAQAQC